MTDMINTPEPHSDSEDSDSLQPPPSISHTKSLSPKSKSFTYQPNIKSKLLSLKNKNIMHSSSPTKLFSTSSVSLSFTIIITPPVMKKSSPLPPNYNLQIIPHNNLSSHHSQLPPLSSPPYFHTSPLPDDTNFDNFSNDSPIHNVWQSTKLHHPNPPPIRTNDNKLTSVICVFDQSESPVKAYSSCLFPPE